MLDEKKVYKIKSSEGKVLELEFTFKAFKRLHSITGNGFKTIDDFNNSSENRLELLPTMIKATSDTDMTLEEIEEQFLGFNMISIMQMSTIIFNLLNMEMKTEVKSEENIETVKSAKKKKR